jgi:hypothetical protein
LKRAEKKKKRKTLVLTLGSPSKKCGKKNSDINPGQPAGKGRGKKNPGINFGQVRRLHSEPVEKGRKKKKKKKTLVLTLSSPPEKGGEKKTLGLTLGRPPDFDFGTWTSISRPGPVRPSRSCPFVEVLKPRSAPGRTDGRTDGHHVVII